MTDPVESGHAARGAKHGEGGTFDPAPHRPSGRAIARVVAVVFVILAALAIAGIVPRVLHSKAMGEDERRAATDVLRVRVARAERVATEATLSLPGSVQPLQETAIYARASGYVRKWHFDIGAQVKKGQVLVELDVPDVDQQLRQAEAAANQARAAIAQAKSQLELARTTNHRYSTLGPSGVVSQQEVEQAQSTLAVQQANVEASEAAYLSAQANVHRFEDLRSFATIMAPFDGVVTMRAAEVGQLVTSGTGMGQALFKVAEVDVVRVFVNVPQLYAAGIKVGMDAPTTMRETPGRTFVGKVARTANELDTSTRALLTEVDIPNPDRALVAGMYATVSFGLSRQDHPIYVPSMSVLFDSAGTRVAVVRDGVVSWRKVVIDSDSGDRLALSTGLAEGDLVVLTPSERLVEGMHVNAEEAKAQDGAKPGRASSPPEATASGRAR